MRSVHVKHAKHRVARPTAGTEEVVGTDMDEKKIIREAGAE